MKVTLVILWVILFWGSNSFAEGKPQMPHPWSKANLFDTKTKTYYIPYELWTGASWNGVKEKKLHKADWTHKRGDRTIKGWRPWNHPKLNNQVFNVYHRFHNRRNKTQLFIMRDKGWGRVYDSRPEKDREDYFDGGVKFPAGGGWKLGERFHSCQRRWRVGRKRRRPWRRLAVEIAKGGMKWGKNDILESLTYMYYINGELNNSYIYEPNGGLVKVISGGRPGKYQGDCD